jgi:polyisoprenyl-teichoic acid--peptidoglycan teichoic acid transferase
MSIDRPPMPRKRSILGRLLSALIFRVFPVLLLLAVLCSGYFLVSALVRQTNEANELASRHEAYQGTATALAASDNVNAPAVPNDGLLLVQFMTNTPEGSVPATEVPAVQPTTEAPVSQPAQPTTDPAVAPPPTLAPVGETTPVSLPTFFPPADQPAVAFVAGTAVPTKVPVIPRDYELVNILLIGDDNEVTQDGSLRTDTMLIVSINTETRTVSMLNLPRDLFVYIPTPTMTRLNTVYGIGESFGWTGGGFGLLRETIFYNFGINVHYYAKINFTGFETIVDTLGGVDIGVECRYEEYFINDIVDPNLPKEQNYHMRKLDVGYYTMDGRDALWYVRIRNKTTDFDRGRRQQQLLRAIMRKALSTGQIQKVPELWGELTKLVETNIPFDTMLGLLPIALNLNPDDIESYTMIRTYHTTPWQPTEGPLAGQAVQLPNYEPIHQLMVDFYTPPTTSQLSAAKPSVAIYNGTAHPGWDKVAASRLREAGFNAYAAGDAPAPAAQTTILDFVGSDKGSLTPELIKTLRLPDSSASTQPDPARQVDYQIVVGEDYNSCAAEGYRAGEDGAS